MRSDDGPETVLVDFPSQPHTARHRHRQGRGRKVKENGREKQQNKYGIRVDAKLKIIREQ